MRSLQEAICTLESLLETDARSLRRIKRTFKAPSERLIQLLKKKAEMDSAKKPKFIGQVGYLGLAFSFDGRKDTYLHYTRRDVARKILKQNKLDNQGNRRSNFAVSLTYGKNVPGTQRGRACGLRNTRECDIVAIIFKSDTQPKMGHHDEVVFWGPVKIKNARMLDINSRELKSIVSKLNGMPNVGNNEFLDITVWYDQKDIENAKLKASNYVRDPDDEDSDWQGFVPN